MEKGDIIKIKMKPSGDVIGIIDTISPEKIRFSVYFYNGRLNLSPGCSYKHTIEQIEPIEILNFKNRLLLKGYSYDDETKTLIHEL